MFVHEDGCKMLLPSKDPDSLDQARAALIGEAPSLSPQEHEPVKEEPCNCREEQGLSAKRAE
jgi:hypothetical protein